MFKAIGNYQYSPVTTPVTTQLEMGASPICNSIVAIENASAKLSRRDLPAKCLIQYSDSHITSSYSNLKNMDYSPDDSKWSCCIEGEMGDCSSCNAIYKYKNATITVADYNAKPLFSTASVHPPFDLTQDFKSLKDIFDAAEKREDSRQSDSV